MKLDISLSEESLDAAIRRLEQAQVNLHDSVSTMVLAMGQTAMLTAENAVHVCSGDLKANLEANLNDMAVEEEEPFVFATYVIADVAASTPGCRWRRGLTDRARWRGQHYAMTEETRDGGGHEYIAPGLDAAKAAFPSFVQAVAL